jgi:hypothetical protein
MTCFINVIIQALFRKDEIREFILNYRMNDKIRRLETGEEVKS